MKVDEAISQGKTSQCCDVSRESISQNVHHRNAKIREVLTRPLDPALRETVSVGEGESEPSSERRSLWKTTDANVVRDEKDPRRDDKIEGGVSIRVCRETWKSGGKRQTCLSA